MPYALELEQISRQAEDDAVEAFYNDGVTDGFEGIKPQCAEIVYLQGYCQGMRNFSAQMQRDAAMLEYEGQEVERMAAAIPF
ncbi:MAG: hypothetical protein ACRCZS_15960 [Chroococcidiopsis sp.]